MKTKEDEKMSSRLNELIDEELKEVTGGNGTAMTEGTAGAYGGDGSGRISTATGEIVDDHSMGVAISMSRPDYRSYLGKTILIHYGGMTVMAKINDVGALNGRDLDLQPGVFRSFGCGSCADWGIRPISFCIL